MEQEEFVLRGHALTANRENQDWFVYSGEVQNYIGKVIVRPHSVKGPFIAFFGREEVSDRHPDLESAIDSIALRLSLSAGETA